VGTFAVQIAKSYGAEVTAVTSTRNQDLVRTIGADHAIDYTQQDFTRTGEKYDVIIDTIGNHSITSIRRVLTATGICVQIGFPGTAGFFGRIIYGAVSSKLSSKKVGFFVAKSNSKDLEILKELIEQGKIKPVIDRTYMMKEVADAVRYVEGPNHRPGHARGKVVVTID
jgi:NADPH:quinone reductase-like Zn-dependent oxidoreductase